MSQYDDDEDDDLQEPTPRDLRKQLEKQKRDNAKLAEQLAQFQVQQRDAAVKAAVEASGLNPKIAALVPKDLAPDAVGTWLTEYAEVFGGSTAQAAPTEPDVKPDTSGLDSINTAQSQGSASSGGDGSDVIAKINSAKDDQEVWQILRAAGVPVT